ncbi:MAG: hypothetical protein QF464_20910, partial [Myxococcota bacterium]|nr:hypothetical protein [Myxococcota bacterium]
MNTQILVVVAIGLVGAGCGAPQAAPSPPPLVPGKNCVAPKSAPSQPNVRVNSQAHEPHLGPPLIISASVRPTLTRVPPLLVEPARAPRAEVAAFGRCQVLDVQRVRTSSQSSEALHALDGDVETAWNAGAWVPQAIELELPAGAQVSGVLLLPDMTPNFGVVTHVVEVARPGGAFDQGHAGRA